MQTIQSFITPALINTVLHPIYTLLLTSGTGNSAMREIWPLIDSFPQYMLYNVYKVMLFLTVE